MFVIGATDEPWVKRGLLVYYRMALMACFIVPAAAIFHFDWLYLLAKLLIGVPLVAFGWDIFAHRKEGKTSDIRLNKAIWSFVAMFVGIGLLAWALVATPWTAIVSRPYFPIAGGIVILILVISARKD